MNNYRVYRFVAFKSRQAVKRGTRLPWVLRTLRQLGIPLNRVKELNEIDGIGGFGGVSNHRHVRKLALNEAKYSSYHSDWYCFWHYEGRYRCTGGPRSPGLRKGCNPIRRVR